MHIQILIEVQRNVLKRFETLNLKRMDIHFLFFYCKGRNNYKDKQKEASRLRLSHKNLAHYFAIT